MRTVLLFYYSKRMMMVSNLILLLPFLIALGACGAYGPNRLEGTWKLTQFECKRGSVMNLPENWNTEITYSPPNIVVMTHTGPTCAVKLSGEYQKKGLTVSEKFTQQDCGTSCLTPELGPSGLKFNCAGISKIEITRESRINLTDLNTLQQTQHSPLQLCDSIARTRESQLFKRAK